MKETCAVLLRMASAVLFLLGILATLGMFSLKTGIIMIVLGVAGWNIGGLMLRPDRKKYAQINNAEDKEEEHYVELQPIDYSMLPYNIGEHMPRSETNRYQALSDISLINNIMEEFSIKNPVVPKLEICTEEVVFNGSNPTYLEFPGNTKTGKVPKYIAILHYRTDKYDDPETSENYFGDIYYLKDGNIGKAKLIYWRNKSMYEITLGLSGLTLTVKKVDFLSTGDMQKKTIYKS